MFLRAIIIASLYCILTACCNVPPVMLENLQLGKYYFAQGDFKCAFRQLLPIAVYGKPDAEYAVGYMYYYGFGVPRDTESGLFWMEKSARAGYCRAIQAMELIRRGPQLCGTEPFGYVTDEQERQLKGSGRGPSCSSCFRKASSYPPVRHEQPRSYQDSLRSVRVSQNNDDAFALQLYGSFKLSHVQNLQNELNMKRATRIWHTRNQSKDWYVLTYGSYGSIADARLARDDLPGKVSDLEPWVRKLNNLQRV